jgi:CheY-like chemotaxis protein
MTELQRVLFADDEADIRTILSLSLGTVGGYAIRSCTSGYEVLREVHGFAPDLILLDVRMPNLSGPETLIALGKNRMSARIPVVFMTAQSTLVELEQCLIPGLTGLIVKPFNAMTLAKDLLPFCALRAPPRPESPNSLHTESGTIARQSAEFANCSVADSGLNPHRLPLLSQPENDPNGIERTN